MKDEGDYCQPYEAKQKHFPRGLLTVYIDQISTLQVAWAIEGHTRPAGQSCFVAAAITRKPGSELQYTIRSMPTL